MDLKKQFVNHEKSHVNHLFRANFGPILTLKSLIGKNQFLNLKNKNAEKTTNWILRVEDWCKKT